MILWLVRSGSTSSRLSTSVAVENFEGINTKLEGKVDSQLYMRWDDTFLKKPKGSNQPFDLNGWTYQLDDGCQIWVVATQIFFIFTLKIGEDEPILTNLFQRGWNHQPEIFNMRNGWIFLQTYHPFFFKGRCVNWTGNFQRFQVENPLQIF